MGGGTEKKAELQEQEEQNLYKRLMRNSDEYKEASRVYRRTVFTEKDWCI